MIIKGGVTSNSIDVQILDDTGLAVTGLVAATFPTLTYSLGDNVAAASFPALSDLAAITTAWASGGVKERSGGWYRLDCPDAMFATAGKKPHVLGESSGKHVLHESILLVAFDPTDAVRMGQTALPNAAAAATGGLPILGANTGTQTISGPVTYTGGFVANITGSLSGNVGGFTGGTLTQAFPANFSSFSIDASGRVVVITYVGNTLQTGDSYAIVNDSSFGNSKLVRSTTPGNTFDVSATGEGGLDFNNIKDATGAHTLTNITVPVVTLTNTVTALTNLPSIPANWLTSAGIASAALNGKGDWMVSYTQPTGFLAATFPSLIASTTNITAGTIATVTTLTNLPAITADWLTGTGVAASAVTKIQAGLATPTNITAGVITTVTNLTNLPAITANWLTAAGIAASALNGKGDWLLSSSYTAPPTAASIAALILVTPANKLTTDSSGFVTFNNTITPPATVTLDGSQPNYAPAKAGDAMALTGGERTSVAAAVWNALTSGLSTANSIGKRLVDFVTLLVYAAPPSATENRDALLQGLIAAPGTISGSTAAALIAAGAAGDPWSTLLPGSYTSTQAGGILSAIQSNTAKLPASFTVGSTNSAPVFTAAVLVNAPSGEFTIMPIIATLLDTELVGHDFVGYQNTAQTVPIAVYDGDGNAVPLTGKTIQFTASQKNVPNVPIITHDNAGIGGITIPSSANNVAVVSIIAADTATVEKLIWGLIDITNAPNKKALGRGVYDIQPISQKVT